MQLLNVLSTLHRNRQAAMVAIGYHGPGQVAQTAHVQPFVILDLATLTLEIHHNRPQPGT